jgi:predicted GNAT superfamily acetyltransferase
VTAVVQCSVGTASGAGDVIVRDIAGPREMADCDRLYGTVMGLRPGDGGINPRLLTALQHNGGYVVGAFLDEELVGFAYSFAGWDGSANRPEAVYQYSQLAVVADSMQGRGIGRRLKYAQRDRCLADGISLMRWAFDPLKTRNAHFNLDVLGGVLAELVPAMYGSRGFGVDRDDESDRFIVDWHLRRARSAPRPMPSRAATLAAGQSCDDGEDLLVAMPARWDSYRVRAGAGEAAQMRHQLRTTFSAALASGRVGVSCQRVTSELACYRFSPPRMRFWSNEQGH